MPTQLKYATRLAKNKDFVLLTSPENAATLSELTDQEAEFLNGQVAKKQRLVTFNRFSHRIYVLVLPVNANQNLYYEELRKAGETLQKAMKADKIQEIEIYAPENHLAALYLAEGLYLSNYEFITYKSDKSTATTLETITLTGENLSENEVTELNNVLDAVTLTRDLVNEPLNMLDAEQFSVKVMNLGKKAGFYTEVLDELMIQSLKMGGLMAVSQGSDSPPTFSIMEWKPANAQNTKPYVLVGKGVMYDTGGYSIKPTPASMDLMKSDMAGGASVTGVMYAVAKNNLPIHVIALVPATANMISSKAYVPGDVITMHNGKTVEVLNTDAEGRLLLADALSFAKKYDPELVIDVATLTGAAARAIGKEGLVMMGTATEEMKSALKTAGDQVHERLVEFPLWDEYQKHIESEIADIKNIGMAEGGAISAGKFLQNFTDYNWIHLDIAGVAFLMGPDSYRGKQATGSSVRLMYQFLKNKAR